MLILGTEPAPRAMPTFVTRPTYCLAVAGPGAAGCGPYKELSEGPR